MFFAGRESACKRDAGRRGNGMHLRDASGEPRFQTDGKVCQHVSLVKGVMYGQRGSGTRSEEGSDMAAAHDGAGVQRAVGRRLLPAARVAGAWFLLVAA